MKVYGKNAGISKISGSLQEHRDIDFKDLVHWIHRNFHRKFSFNFQVALVCDSDLSRHNTFTSHIVSVSGLAPPVQPSRPDCASHSAVIQPKKFKQLSFTTFHY